MLKLNTTNNWLYQIFTKGKWYIFSNLFSKGIAFITIPIYTYYFSKADYGTLSVISSFTQFFPFLITLQLESAFGRYFHDYKNDTNKLNVLFSTIFWFVLIFGLILIIFLSLFSLYIENFINVPKLFLIISFVTILFTQLNQLGIVFLRQDLETKLTTFIDVSMAISSTLITLFLILQFKYGIISKLVGSLFSVIMLFIFFTKYLIKKNILAFTFNKNILIKCLKYSIPLMPFILSGWISTQSDKLFINNSFSKEKVATYFFATNISVLLYVLQDAFTQVLGPLSISGLINDKEETKNKMKKLNYNLWIIMLLSWIILTLTAPFFVKFIGHGKYNDSLIFIIIISFTYVISSQYRSLMDIISFHQKTWILSTGGILQALSSLSINFFLLPKYGLVIASISIIISTLIITLWLYYWAHKLEKFSFSLKKMLLSLIIAIVINISLTHYIIK